MKHFLILLSIAFIWTCSSGGGGKKGPTEPTTPTQPPTVSNLTITTNEDTPAAITLQGTDPGNFALTYAITTAPSKGTFTLSGKAGTYTPNTNYNGADSFIYTASNGSYTSSNGTVSITITAVDDDPNSMNVSAVTEEDTSVTFTLEAEEVDGDSITFQLKTNPSNGSASISNDQATYTPNENYYGSDSFTFEAVDNRNRSILNTATASITITPVNDAPTIQDMEEIEGVEDTDLTITPSGEDIDGDNLSFYVVDQPTQGTMTEKGATLIYTPNADFYGADSLTYAAYDGTTYSEAKKIPLFIDRGPRDWPFLYDYRWLDGVAHTQPADFEGRWADYDKNGFPDLAFNLYPEFKGIGMVDADGVIFQRLIIPEDEFPDIDFTKILGGYFGFGDVNKDGYDDIWYNPFQEEVVDGICCDISAGPLFIILTNGGYDDVKWIHVDSNLNFWESEAMYFNDFDNDGDIDLVGRRANPSPNPPYLSFYKNIDNQSFTLDKTISLNHYFSSFKLSDLNNDGFSDIISFGSYSEDYNDNPGMIVLFSNNSNNNYTEFYHEIDIGVPRDITVVDYDSDGNKDVLLILDTFEEPFAQAYVNKLYAFKGTGSSFFRDTSQKDFDNITYLRPGQIGRTTAWDFDNDGDKDIFHLIAYKNNDPFTINGKLFKTCASFDFTSDALNNEVLNQGYFWKNNDGFLEKTYYSTKPDTCHFEYPSYWGYFKE